MIAIETLTAISPHLPQGTRMHVSGGVITLVIDGATAADMQAAAAFQRAMAETISQPNRGVEPQKENDGIRQ
jgi:hypothetical protein